MPGTPSTVDVVGIGAGPSNLGLAAAVADHNRTAATPVTMRILERRRDATWHPGMLLEGSSLQVSFLKDLATLRDPSSPFTFLNYLRDRGRLVDFVNLQSFFPTRLEFADYLAWVAEKVDAEISLDADVSAVQPLSDQPDGARALVRYTGPDGAGQVRARSVVVATGLRERLPDWAHRGPRLFHNHRLLEHLAGLDLDPGRDRAGLLVVGGGQSAAEVVRHLHRNHPRAIVSCAFSSYGFQPADDSPFANRVFDPDAVDDFYYAPPEVRAGLMERHRTTNYSCVEPELITELYSTEYNEKVCGARRLRFLPATEVTWAEADDSGVDVRLVDRLAGEERIERFAAVVCATGFHSVGVTEVLADRGLDPDTTSVDRWYRLTTDGEVVPGVFVQGATESTHGLGSTLLSNIAARSAEILEGVLETTPAVATTGGRV